MAEKSKRKTFIALTIMGLAAAIGILNKDTLANMGPLAMGLGVLCLVVVIALYFIKTKAGQETGQDFKTGAGQVAQDAKEAAEKAKETAEKAGAKVGEAVEKGKEWVESRRE